MKTASSDGFQNTIENAVRTSKRTMNIGLDASEICVSWRSQPPRTKDAPERKCWEKGDLALCGTQIRTRFYDGKPGPGPRAEERGGGVREHTPHSKLFNEVLKVPS